jgi:protein ImuB
MYFAAIYVPDFPVQALVRVEPELRNRPVVVLEGTPPLHPSKPKSGSPGTPLLRVAACNQRARQAGVRPGMTKLEAEARLDRQGKDETGQPAGQLRRRSPAQETAALAALRDCAWAFSPRVENDSAVPHTVVLDLAGLQRLFGPPAGMALALVQRAREMGLEANVALASNPEAAVCAAWGFPGITMIAPGEEAERLGVLPVEVLLQAGWVPHPERSEGRGLGNRIAPARRQGGESQAAGETQPASAARAAEILETLARWGIRTCRALAALPETAVAQRLGPAGVQLQKLARGASLRPLVPAEPPLQFEETAELEFPAAVLEPLAFLLNRMLEQLCARLAARALSAQEIALRLSLSPKEQEIDDRSGAGTKNNGPQEGIHPNAPKGEVAYVLRFPVPMLDAKAFLRLLQLELQARPPGAPVEKIVLSAEPVAPRFLQGGLFLPVSPEPQKLEVMLARIRNVVAPCRGPRKAAPEWALRASGPLPDPARSAAPPRQVRGGLSTPARATAARAGDPGAGDTEGPAANLGKEDSYAGAAELLDMHRPDAFRMRRFPPALSRSGSAVGSRAGKSEEFSTHSVLRRFRPPQPVKVQVEDGRPQIVSYVAAPAPGKRVTKAENSIVLWAGGPWRESGEWWMAQPWSREVWDVALQQDGAAGIYRLYRDAIQDRWFVEGEYD